MLQTFDGYTCHIVALCHDSKFRVVTLATHKLIKDSAVMDSKVQRIKGSSIDFPKQSSPCIKSHEPTSGGRDVSCASQGEPYM
jgi:hypothetical protein